jgi:cell shape-determining protein MreC
LDDLFFNLGDLIMKNFIMAVMISLTSSFAMAECVGGSCSTPVRSLGTVVVRTTGAIVTAPFRVVNKVATNSKSRRVARYNARHSQ